MFCKNCGSEMNDGATFCPKCGAQNTPQQPQNPAGGQQQGFNFGSFANQVKNVGGNKMATLYMPIAVIAMMFINFIIFATGGVYSAQYSNLVRQYVWAAIKALKFIDIIMIILLLAVIAMVVFGVLKAYKNQPGYGKFLFFGPACGGIVILALGWIIRVIVAKVKAGSASGFIPGGVIFCFILTLVVCAFAAFVAKDEINK